MKLSQLAAIIGAVGLCRASPVRIEKRDNSSISSIQLSSDKSFHYELLRDLSIAAYDGSDINEILTAASEIKAGDFESYYATFNKLATRVHEQAKGINLTNHPISARRAFFKAATYYRSADFFLRGNWTDPRVYSLWDKHLEAFNTAISLLPVPGQRVTLHAKGNEPNSNFSIPIIFYGCGLPGPRPTIIMGNGYDGAQEEMYHVLGKAALDRGINVITYEGPGQPTVRREQKLGFIPEWEKVVTPVVDYALTRPEVRVNAIGLMGLSFGGFLAPRAAAVEKRIAAVIALDGIYDFGESNLRPFPPQLKELFKSGSENAKRFDSIVEAGLAEPSADTFTRWAVQQGLWSFNTESPFEWLSQTQKYNMDGFVQNITMPVFVADAQNDQFFPGQAKALADKIGSKFATYHEFRAVDGAGEHCSVGASVLANQILLDWFEDIVRH
ncbi:2,6-dihydropseudooxynicotine hydrolase [Nannizzia gypsea CBS 118893]|uniref:2,6-dihydropseudooxynicotine hydrolase n=1 Tax=Arthroderma gypseum (strain ATCC MYA-4604 / CBS 118893) TaxID=535722 RepID=E4UUN3_ARTGP|nr:2,6-dihydropseudooxynicotine hydrolase [Nannizzia gypsea CBS 118893]EFR01000.1 2,6-dihydropseudooxynicotine hydrolase [Nannizzia gypsea CBS 118893]